MLSGQIYTEINKTEKIYFLFYELERNWTKLDSFGHEVTVLSNFVDK